jgi:hypothetical protein
VRFATLLLLFFLFTTSTDAQDVYKTPYGKKYHLASCRMVENVSEKLSVADAVERGLGACKICNPPTQLKQNAITSQEPRGEDATVQCKGTTKQGTRCRHRTSIGNGYCFQHNPDKKKS